jgi:hypothetical protein
MTFADRVIDQPTLRVGIKGLPAWTWILLALPGSLQILSDRANPHVHSGRCCKLLNRSKQLRAHEASLRKIDLWFNRFTPNFHIGVPRMGES